MKFKKIIILLLAIMSAMLIISCKKEQKHTVTFISRGETVDTQTVSDNALLTDPNTPIKDGGFIFKGWYQGNKLWNFKTDTVKYDITLTAKWNKLYTVVFDSDGGTQIAARSAEENSLVSKPDSPKKDGYFFDGWYIGDSKWDFNSDMVTDNIILTAKWKTVFNVTFDSDGGSAVDPQEVADGHKISKPESPTFENNAFIGWYNGTEIWDFENDTVSADITLTAKWESTTTYKVIFNSDGGSYTPATQHIKYDGYVSRVVSPSKNGFTFLGWIGHNGELWDFASDTITEEITLTAKWEENVANEGVFLPVDRWLYYIKFNASNGEDIDDLSVSARKTLDECGKHLPTPEKEGYTFGGWYLDSERFDEYQVVSKDLTLNAKWGYTVTFDYGISEMSDKLVFAEVGEKLNTPTEPVQDGKQFLGWYNGDVKWNFETDTVTSDITLTAKWG